MSDLSYVLQLFIPLWYFQTAGSSIIGCPDVTPSAISYVDSGVTWCYWLKNTPESSTYQQIMCANNGGTLANIPSVSHEAAVTTALDSTWSATADVYIGVRDQANIGDFRTWAGASLTYDNWAGGEPQSSKFCVFMQSITHLWFATHCNDHLQAVCYCVIDPLDTYTCTGTVVTGSVSTNTTTAPTSGSTTLSTSYVPTSGPTTVSNVCVPSSLTSCLSCCYAQTTPTTSSLGTSFTDIVADLKVNIKQTNKYRRTLISAADHRPLSVSIGTAAILILFTVVAVIVTCDLPVLVTQLNLFVRSLRRLLCPRPKTRVVRHPSIKPSNSCDQTTAAPPTRWTT